MSNATITQQISCINFAMSKGFTIDDSIDLFDNYNEAKEYLFDNKPSILPIIEGNYRNGYFYGNLPLSRHEASGEFYYNQKSKRWEDIAQDLDGGCYLIISK